MEHQLRFIPVLTPMNAYLRGLVGDGSTLLQGNFASIIILSDEEVLSQDGQVFESCFNVLRVGKT